MPACCDRLKLRKSSVLFNPWSQTIDNFLGGLDAPLGRLFHHVGDQVDKVVGHVGVELSWVPWRFFAVASRFLTSGTTWKWDLSRDRIIQRTA